MADTKVTALTENTTVASTDILYLVDDPGGSAASQKATVANVVAAGIVANLIDDTHIDWGTGADQVSAADVPIADAGTYYTTDDVESALAQAGPGISGMRVLISEQTPSGTGTVTWSSIPATYKHLTIEYVCRSTKAAVTFENMYINLNNDTTATNYRYARKYGYAAGTVGGDGGADRFIDDPPAANAPAGSCTTGRIWIGFYAGTTFNKQVTCNASNRRDDSSVYEFTIQAGIEWENTAAINRIDLLLAAGNFVAGSTFRLYGCY